MLLDTKNFAELQKLKKLQLSELKQKIVPFFQNCCKSWDFPDRDSQDQTLPLRMRLLRYALQSSNLNDFLKMELSKVTHGF